MKDGLISIVVSLIVSLVAATLLIVYAPVQFFDWFHGHQVKYGTTVTTILGSDTLSASRTTLNNNFSALNNGKIENSSSSVAAITTLSNLVTVGTIASGVWNGTAVTVPFGGTGSTTLSSNQVLLGNGTGILKTVSGWGASGQLLTSNGAAVAPTWQSASFDTTANYALTGLWNLVGSATYIKNFFASSTVANPMNLNGVNYSMPAADGSAYAHLMTSGAGVLTWEAQGATLCTNIAKVETSSSASTTLATCTIPANTLNTSNTIMRIYATYDSGGGSNCAPHISWGNGTATDTPLSFVDGGGGTLMVDITATGTTKELASGVSFLAPAPNTNNSSSALLTSKHYASTSIAAVSYVSFNAKANSGTCTLNSYTVQVSSQR